MASSNNNFTITYPAQLRYLLQWFQEFSEMQKSNFLPILLNKFSTKTNVNGLIPGLENLATGQNRRPPTLFQCRMKLFEEWAQNWSDNEKEQLINSLKSLDEDFMKKYEEQLPSSSGNVASVNLNNNNEMVNGDHKEEDVDLEDNII